jgi:archaellum component FlaC
VKDLELENLVDEYSKLAANAEERRASEMALTTALSTENEVLSTKVQALEQALSNVADRTSVTKQIVIPSSTPENATEFQSKILHLNELLLQKDAEIEKITNVYNRACDELKTFMEQQSEVSVSSANVEGLKQEIVNVTEMLKVSQEQLKVSEADFAKRIAAAKIEREAEVARLQAQSELDVAAITEGFTVEIKRLEAEVSVVSGQFNDDTDTKEAVHAKQIVEIKAEFENAMLICKKQADEVRYVKYSYIYFDIAKLIRYDINVGFWL